MSKADEIEEIYQILEDLETIEQDYIENDLLGYAGRIKMARELIKAQQKEIEHLKEYKHMYENLCK